MATTTVPELVDDIVAEIVERFDPKQVVLFGSYAAGNPGEWSDIDLLVVMETRLRPLQQAAAISRELDHRVPIDILVRTPEQFASPDPRDLILRSILREGVLAYEAGDRRLGPGR